ncbi:acyl-CoA thioesterase [Neisseria lisongii]|uniref:Acyl-CoA thioesterase n=1 Tax=Neisseria lisongii TaxID=2912188 RepID=A0AAW5AFW1_9NEIS|nr:thioesterase family protein [Neisseria lisongii]MCF7529950.1 acyl-CoA thioesterase [Neisseria lisongii]
MQIRVRNYHLDGYGHVNNARYLEFLEEARWAFFDTQGWLPLLDNICLAVVRADLRYRRPAFAGDDLRVHIEVKELSSRYLVLRQNIELAAQGKNAVEADITLMPIDAASGKAVRLPEPLFNLLNTLNA